MTAAPTRAAWAALLPVLAALAGAAPADCPPCAAARRTMDRLSPRGLEERLAASGGGPELGELAAGLAVAGSPLVDVLQDYLGEVAAARGRRLARAGGPWEDADVRSLLDLALVDAGQFAGDTGFAERVLPVAARALPRDAPAALRDHLLWELHRAPGVGFDLAERVELAWRSIRRSSAEREVPFAALGRLTPGDPDGPVEASIYSLGPEFFDFESAAGFLRGVRSAAPDREVVVLADLPMRRRLEDLEPDPRLHLIETWGRPYTPWPRDPIAFLRAADGGLVAVLRPNRQARREEDAWMARELIQELPPGLDRSLGRVRWTIAPVPFHNGHILLTAGSTWISIHTLEVRILQLLGLERVPVETFATPEGVRVYLDAARRAADELGELFGLPARFVHPLPAAADAATLARAMELLGGGAGFDLDSLLTVLPGTAGPSALVGDLGLGEDLVLSAPVDELRGLARGYGLAPEPEALRRRLTAAQRAPRGAALDAYLDLAAAHLEREGLPVSRLPLLLVPNELLTTAPPYPDPDFLLGWNNVVVERLGSGFRAEGFASLLPRGDKAAMETFAAHGVELRLLPTLVESVRRNGGYRCASNHVR